MSTSEVIHVSVGSLIVRTTEGDAGAAEARSATFALWTIDTYRLTR